MNAQLDIDANAKKIITILSIIIGGLIIIILIFTLVIPLIKNGQKKTYVDIAVAPTNATLKLNGENINAGTNELEPGDYHLEISAEGFKTKDVNFTVKKHEDQSIVEYLTNTSEGMRYYFRSRDDIAILQAYAKVNPDNQEVAGFIEKYTSLIKITDNLPIVTNYLVGANMVSGKITDGSNNPQCHFAFCLQVNQTREYEWRVRECMKLAGYNYDDYEVIYEN